MESSQLINENENKNGGMVEITTKDNHDGSVEATQLYSVQNSSSKENNDQSGNYDMQQPEVRQYKWYNVNTEILPSKLAFFFDAARRVGCGANLVLFLTGIGLSKVEAGLILGFRWVNTVERYQLLM